MPDDPTMDYYEELGLAPSAGAAEIHGAYRNLVALLHPDRCRDTAQRRAAEAQLRRLNAIMSVLGDPARRRRYDLARVPPRPCSRRRWAWPCLGAAVLAAILALAWPKAPTARPDPPVRIEPTTATVAAPPRPARRTRPRLGPRRAAVPRRSSLEPPELAATPIPPAAAVALAPLPPPPAPEEPAAPHAPRIAGTWIFARPPAVESRPGLYSAEYVELTVRETAAGLSGHFRGQYRVPDRAISPSVAFDLEGPAAERESECAWTAAGGAHGGVRLKLARPDVLEVSWWATGVGSLGLTSGSATLLRAREP